MVQWIRKHPASASVRFQPPKGICGLGVARRKFKRPQNHVRRLVRAYIFGS